MIPTELQTLADKFSEHFDSYKNPSYNEMQVRGDFIDKFIGILGWDVANEEGVAEFFREVVKEDRQQVDGHSKSPDYCIQFGGKKLFFIEAKKPSKDLQYDTEAAFQVRRYGWSAGLPVCMLTSFNEFAVYDTTLKPLAKDSASIARIFFCKYDRLQEPYDDNQTNWEFVYNLFSKERVFRGSLDKFKKDDKRRGTQLVDEEFLKEIEQWREILAHNIAYNNTFDINTLNDIVQKTIDRIIFLRICEDKGIEPENRLKDVGNKNNNLYSELLKLFDEADEKYNSGLFYFQNEKDIKEPPDRVSHNTKISDKSLKDIIKSLYYPSPYNFAQMPADILGSVYERFLGKKIILTSKHRCEVVFKPEVIKAGGIFYTPNYIAEYIVNNTIQKQLKEKTLLNVKNYKVVDPACGSGSFLIVAYQCLLDWYLEEYLKDVKKHKKQIIKIFDGSFRLHIHERKRILTNHIFGVDIDRQAVEVTKLSLLLKALEGVKEQEIERGLFNERALPNLSNNVKCGNSLIDLDYYGNQVDFEEEERVKPFSWQKAFPDVFNQGGFDCAVGNPPYGALFSDNEQNYLKNEFSTFAWRGESYLLFVDRGLELLKQGGLLGFIIPDTLLNLGFTQSIRDLLLQNSKLQEIVALPSNVFPGASVDTIILLTEKAEFIKTFHAADVNVKIFEKKNIINSIINPQRIFTAKSKDWFEQNAFNLQIDSNEKKLIFKIETSNNFINDVAKVFYGIKVYQVGKGKPKQTTQIRDEKPFTSETRPNNQWLPFYDGKHIGRYQLLWKNNNWLNYGEWLAEPRNSALFGGEKILIRKITGNTLFATYVPETSYCNTLLFALKLIDKTYSYKCILGILNSKLIGWYFRKKFQINPDDTFPQIMIRDILQLPVPNIELRKQNEIEKNVDLLLQLNQELLTIILQNRIEQIHSRIAYSEDQVNTLVYELYGLSDSEIAIIESS